MKFLADMGISPKTVHFLHRLGYDAVHLHEQELDRMPDPDILKKAVTEKYILLTHDLDFGELVAASGADVPSVIIFRLRNMKPENVNVYLKGIIIRHHEELERGAVISVTEAGTRVRLLPVESIKHVER